MPYSDQVDAEPVRRHVQALVEAGMSVTQIQFLSGVDRTCIRVLLGVFPNRAASRQVRQLTASRLLRTRLDRGSTVDGLVPAAGTRRRIQALVAIGWTLSAIGNELGSGANMQAMLRRDLVRAATAIKVSELYDRWWQQAPPHATPRQRAAATMARAHARCRGWLPPLAWNDDTIDDPAAAPELGAESARRAVDEVVVDRIMGGQLRIPVSSGRGSSGRDARPELVEAVRRLHGLGLSDREIGQRVGRGHSAVQGIRRRDRLQAAAAGTGLPGNGHASSVGGR